MSQSQDDIRPVLKPVSLSQDSAADVGVWFIESDITNASDESIAPEKKSSSMSKFKSWVKEGLPNAGFGESGDVLVVPIRMTKDEYEQHFDIDEMTGEYLPNVSEPPGGRLEWVKQRFEDQKPKSRRIREVSGLANTTGAGAGTGALSSIGISGVGAGAGGGL